MLAKFKEWGWDARDRTVRRAVPDAEGAAARAGRADTVHGNARGAGGAGDPTSGQKAEQLPTYNAYSIDGDVTAPLVYVNYGRPEDYEQLDRLGISVRGAIVIARYGQSWRGIKPKVAARARRHRLPDLFRSARRRLRGRRRVSRRPDAARRRRAARQRHGHAGLSRRSAHARRRRDARREAARAQRRDDADEDSGAADLVRRRAAAARGAPRRHRARRLARRAADHVSPRPGPGEGAPEGGVQLGHQAALQRDRDDSAGRRFPTSGSCAATITTRG